MTPSPSPEQMEAAGKIIEEIRNRYVWEKPDTVQMVASVLAARDAAIVKPWHDAVDEMDRRRMVIQGWLWKLRHDAPTPSPEELR